MTRRQHPTTIAPSPAAHDADGPRAHLRGAHVRLPDERARLRAAVADRSRAPATCAPSRRRGRRRRHQHLRRARERRQQALRQPRPPRSPSSAATRACRSPSAAASPRRTSRRHPRQGAVGRRRLRHAQHGLAAEPARAGAPQRRGAARDPRVARDLPVDAADQARLRLQRLGVDLGRLQQHLHVLHRAEPARQGEGPPPRRHPERDPGCSSTTAPSRSPCSARTSTPTASSSATARRSASCCAPPARSRASSASASPARTRPPSPTTSSTRWPRRPPSCRSCTCRCSRAPTASSRRCAARTAASGSSASSTACASASRTPRSRTDIIVGFPGETEEDFEDTLRVVEQARFASAFTFQYSIREGTPAATMPDQVPKAVVQERYERLIALQERISLEENQTQVGRERRGAGRRRARARRMPRRTGSPAAPKTTGSCTSRCPPASRAAAPGRRRHRSSSPTPRRSTCSPTRPTARRCASAARAPATRGTARRRSRARVPAPSAEAGRARGGLARAADPPHRRVSSIGDAHRACCGRVVGATGTGKSALVARSRRGARARGATAPRSSTPTPCSSTAAWTSARPSCRWSERRGIPHHLLRRARRHRRGGGRLVSGCRARRDRRRSTTAAPMRSSSADRGCTCRACCSTSASRRTTTRCARDSRPSSTHAAPACCSRGSRQLDPVTAARVDPQQRAADRARARGARAGRDDARRGAARRAGAVARRHPHRRRRTSPRDAARAAPRRARRADVGGRAARRGRGAARAGPRDGVTARRAIGYAQALAQLAGEPDASRGDRRRRRRSPAATRAGRCRGSSATRASSGSIRIGCRDRRGRLAR